MVHSPLEVESENLKQAALKCFCAEGEVREGAKRALYSPSPFTHPPHVRKEFQLRVPPPISARLTARQQPSQATEFEECQKRGRAIQRYTIKFKKRD